jgi:hypothetical protein
LSAGPEPGTGCPEYPAGSDTAVRSFDQINTRLKVGDAIWVTDGRGREIKGRITSFAPDAIGVEADGTRTLRADEVPLVWTRRHDSLANGALIGAWSGSARRQRCSMRPAPAMNAQWAAASLPAS